MFALPGIFLLLVFIYVRPQEFIPILKSLPLLYLFLGVAIFGYAVDLKLRRTRPELTPQFGWILLFFAWCMLTLSIRAPGLLMGAAVELAIPMALYLLIAHGVQSFRAFGALATTVLVLTLYLSFVGVHQGLAPQGCFVINQASGDGSGAYDGRTCTVRKDCENEDAEPGADYSCEHVGLFGTSSIAGRVRYMGKLNDPNELSMAIACGLPFAFALYERRKSLSRGGLVLGTIVLSAICAVFTQSRGGQLVFLTVLGAYFVKRQGLKGLIYGAILGAPMLMFGGRSGEEAESSSEERLKCWYEGMQMVRAYPIIGVGQGQFTEHHVQTAHNSYVLAPAELGFLGMVFWSIVIYLCVKIPVQALRRLGPSGPYGPEADAARTWGMGLLASWCGLLIGIFFLSFCYHQILWIYIGLAGAFYSAMRAHDEGYEVKLGWRDLWLIVGVDLLLVIVLFVYTKHKVGD
jgi:hypothetical protein